MPASASKVRDHLVNTAIATAATLFLLFGTSAWSRKENASDHRLDIVAIRAEVARVLDVLCEPRANTTPPHACTDPSTTSSPGDVQLPILPVRP